MRIPYGLSDFAMVRDGGYFYVDKTTFLPQLESAEAGYRYLIFLRPRRMGKSLLLSMLEHYYDLGRADRFDALFGGLWIHAQPTPERSSYLVLAFDFSAVAGDAGPDGLRRSFLGAVKTQVADFLLAHRARIPELGGLYDRVESYQDAETLLGMVMAIVGGAGHKLYVLIDEYDSFANLLLSSAQEDLYSSMVDRTGFLRAFYATLKTGTRTGVVSRMFVTGVSPLMLDDLSSGFNIAFNVSQDHRLNTLAGFTRADVERAVDELLAANPDAADDPDLVDRQALLGMLDHYYNGYRFSEAAHERIFNPSLVLYFLRELRRERSAPVDMMDPNARTGYDVLQRLGTLTGTGATARRALLQMMLHDRSVSARLVDQFGTKCLSPRDQFLSLLYYFGMLTIAGEQPDRLALTLEIPNRAMSELLGSHLGITLEEMDARSTETM